MKPYNNQKYKKKNAFTSIFVFVLVLTTSAFFYYVWNAFYNIRLREPFIMKGSIFISFVYAMLYLAFMIALDSGRIDENRLFTTIFLQFLNIFFCDIFAYLVIIMPTYSRGIIEITPLMLTGIAQFISVIVICIIFDYLYKKLFPAMPMLLITNNETMDMLAYKLNQRKDIYNIKDTVSCDRPFDEIKVKCEKYGNVIVGDIESQKRNDILKYCFENVDTTYIMPKLSDIIIKDTTNLYAFDTPMYVSNNNGITGYQAFIKRVVDLLLSIILLIALSPLLIIVAMLIKVEDGGKVLFIQDRVTKDNKIFKILKFRSMKQSNDKDVVRPTGKDDDRITKIGGFIRKTHIDELPQLINVLIGDMSIVGPRPERIEHVELYKKEIAEFGYRLKVKAGITGLAQIYGKYNTTAYDKLKLDLIYIKNYSLLFDIELILKTFKALFLKDNTEGFDKKSREFIEKNAKR